MIWHEEGEPTAIASDPFVEFTPFQIRTFRLLGPGGTSAFGVP